MSASILPGPVNVWWHLVFGLMQDLSESDENALVLTDLPGSQSHFNCLCLIPLCPLQRRVLFTVPSNK